MLCHYTEMMINLWKCEYIFIIKSTNPPNDETNLLLGFIFSDPSTQM